jgi:hypothetical protein
VAGAKQAAEKGLIGADSREKHTSGAEARDDFMALTARLKSSPDTYPGPDEFFRSL